MIQTYGIRRLHAFSPKWTSAGILEKTLIGRKQLVDRYEELIIEGAGGPNKFQSLTIGPRGSGKTHIVRVLFNRLVANDDVSKKLLIVDLLEDELGIATFIDLLKQMIIAVFRTYPETKEQFQTEFDEMLELSISVMEEEGIRLLLKIAGNRDILILIENLGIIFHDVKGFGKEGQAKLRDLVQQNPKFMIFATAQSLFNGVQLPDYPFYQFFSLEHLRPLDFEESVQLIAAVGETHGDEELKKRIDAPDCRSRIRAIHEFTKGNHRLITTFYDFLHEDSLVKLSDKFIAWLDELKPYYQEQMRSLPALQQKIILYLAQERIPRTVAQIAKNCLTKSNSLSKQLNELEKKQLVLRTPKGRESYYEITEALFRICNEADLTAEGAPAPLFIDFLSDYYLSQEIYSRNLDSFSFDKNRIDWEYYIPENKLSFFATFFHLIRNCQSIPKSRFEMISQVLDEVIAPEMDISVLQRFLKVEIAYFKDKDDKALLQLPIEERKVFCEAIGIELQPE